jgi:hypothetical protein
MLIGLVGFANSGKGTAGDILIDELGFEQDSFAAPLKDALAAMFCWPRDLLEGNTKEGRKWRETVDEWWAERLGIPNFTPRMAMQNVGTDVIRRHFNDNLWILSLERRFLNRKNQNVVVTDCRFPNELDLLRRLGGKIVRVKRGPEPEWWDEAVAFNHHNSLHIFDDPKMDKNQFFGAKYGIHESEYAWIGQPFELTIENIEGNLDHLRNTIREFVRSVEDRR